MRRGRRNSLVSSTALRERKKRRVQMLSDICSTWGLDKVRYYCWDTMNTEKLASLHNCYIQSSKDFDQIFVPTANVVFFLRQQKALSQSLGRLQLPSTTDITDEDLKFIDALLCFEADSRVKICGYEVSDVTVKQCIKDLKEWTEVSPGKMDVWTTRSSASAKACTPIQCYKNTLCHFNQNGILRGGLGSTAGQRRPPRSQKFHSPSMTDKSGPNACAAPRRQANSSPTTLTNTEWRAHILEAPGASISNDDKPSSGDLTSFTPTPATSPADSESSSSIGVDDQTSQVSWDGECDEDVDSGSSGEAAIGDRIDEADVDTINGFTNAIEVRDIVGPGFPKGAGSLPWTAARYYDTDPEELEEAAAADWANPRNDCERVNAGDEVDNDTRDEISILVASHSATILAGEERKVTLNNEASSSEPTKKRKVSDRRNSAALQTPRSTRSRPAEDTEHTVSAVNSQCTQHELRCSLCSVPAIWSAERQAIQESVHRAAELERQFPNDTARSWLGTSSSLEKARYSASPAKSSKAGQRVETGLTRSH
jgi:hypothetical protein